MEIESFLILIVVLVVIFIGAIYLIAMKKKKVETNAELEEEAKRLKILLKRIEIEFYKRRLNEEEYKKRSLEYQAAVDNALVKLKIRKERKKPQNPK